MPQAQHIEVFIYNMTLTVLSAIKWVISLFPLSKEEKKPRHGEVKQLASDHTAIASCMHLLPLSCATSVAWSGSAFPSGSLPSLSLPSTYHQS